MWQFGKGPKRVQLKDFFEKEHQKRAVKGLFPPKAAEFIYVAKTLKLTLVWSECTKSVGFPANFVDTV